MRLLHLTLAAVAGLLLLVALPLTGVTRQLDDTIYNPWFFTEEAQKLDALNDQLLPLHRGRKGTKSGVLAFVCRGRTCAAPEATARARSTSRRRRRSWRPRAD